MAASPEVVKRHNQKIEEVYSTLREMIESGKFTSGDPLPVTRQLCVDFETNSEVICKARKKLKEAGLVTICSSGPMTELGTWVL